MDLTLTLKLLQTLSKIEFCKSWVYAAYSGKFKSAATKEAA